jgi:predicted aldo/keto reductase-like oxidoreductase
MLERRPLGGTGVALPLVGFGGIPIMRLDMDQAVDVIGVALEAGIELIDTARGYGDSEKKIGRALRIHDREVFLASKSPRRDREGLLEDFDRSIADLGVKTIDLYQAHCVNRSEDLEKILAPGGAYEALTDLRSAGRIRFIGITSHSTELVKQAIETGKFETIQVLYSILEGDASEEVIPMALEAAIGVLVMKPFGGGCIEDYDLALRFVLSQSGVIALPGMASAEEVVRNVAAASDPRALTREELGGVERVKRELGTRYCRRCDYCQPCPNEVPISVALHIPSVRRRVGEAMMRTDVYRDLLKQVKACDECGQCEDRCPFGLPVRDLLKESRDVLTRVLET